MSSRQLLLDTAAVLFAAQGFEATTTQQISREAGVTEPMIYYHFKGKDELFTHTLTATFTRYLELLDELRKEKPAPFETIERLISVHLDIVQEMPHGVRLIISNCPAKLHDPEAVCAQFYSTARNRLARIVSDALKRGIASGEFAKVQVSQTTNLLVAMLNGILRQRAFQLAKDRGIRKAAVAFCRRALAPA